MKKVCILIPAVLLVIACSGGTPLVDPQSTTTTTTTTLPADRVPGSPLSVSGKLGLGFSVAGIRGRSIASAVSHIGSIPVVAGVPNIGAMQTTPVSSDGSFDLTITPKENESDLLLLINKSAVSLEEKAAGFASLKSADGSDLVVLPLFSAKRHLDFGAIDLSGGSAVSEKTLESQADNFSLSFDRLMETAYQDNLYKHLKNQYVNKDDATKQIYAIRIRCYFTGALESSVNTWFTASSWDHTSGFNMRVDAFSPSGHSYNDVVSGAADLELIPPVAFTIKQPTYITTPRIKFGPASPLFISSVLNVPQGVAAGLMPLPEGEPGSYIVEFDCEENPSDGSWKLSLLKGGVRTEKALFDLQAASPFTPAPENAFMYYIPSVNVVADTAGRISAINLQWCAWNPTVKKYETVSDLTTLRNLISDYSLHIIKMRTDAGGMNYNDTEDAKNTTHFVPSRAWYVGTVIPPGGTGVDWMTLNYGIAGVEYFFTLYPNYTKP